MSHSSQPDLFGTQPDMFGPPPPVSYAPSLAKVRAEVNKVLEKARIAKDMPWAEREVRFWKTVFPQMTNWLPEEEIARARAAFWEEIAKLEAPVGDATRIPAARKKKTGFCVGPPGLCCAPFARCDSARQTQVELAHSLPQSCFHGGLCCRIVGCGFAPTLVTPFCRGR